MLILIKILSLFRATPCGCRCVAIVAFEAQPPRSRTSTIFQMHYRGRWESILMTLHLAFINNNKNYLFAL